MLNMDTNNTGVSEQAEKPASDLDTWLDLTQCFMFAFQLSQLYIAPYTIQISKKLQNNKQENNDQ